MKKRLVALLLGGLMFVFNSVSATAQGSTKAQLIITPTACVIDVTQDGSSQNVQVSSSDCRAALPVLLTPTTREGVEGAQSPGLLSNPTFSLPFAGTGPLQQELALPSNFENRLTPIPRSGPEFGSSPYHFPAHASPILSLVVFGGVLLTLAMATDIALFELRHTKALMQWGRRHTVGK